MDTLTLSDESRARKITAQVQYGDDYVQPLWLAALKSRLPQPDYELVTSAAAPAEPLARPTLQILQYEQLSFELALLKPTQLLINAYIIRKALIRKHFLAATVAGWVAKRPESVLKRHVKIGVRIDIDYVEYLDEALADAFEVRDSIADNAQLPASEREWWILKPGMADGGNGIRLFSTEDELRAIFEELEPESDDEEDEDEDEDKEQSASQHVPPADEEEDDDGFIITNPSDLPTPPQPTVSTSSTTNNLYASQLRHFVAQPYIHPPLLLDHRKFHIRVYVLAIGALTVYVSRPLLALLAAAPYAPPWASATPDLRAHLTNTCVQGSSSVREGSVRAFWELPDDVLPAPEAASSTDGVTDAAAEKQSWKEAVFAQICAITSQVFEAAARNEMVHFQTLPNAFELFGVDFMVDAAGTAWLLEVNAFPDFKQTGEELRVLVGCLLGDVVELAVKPFFFEGAPVEEATAQRMVKVLDIDLGRS